MRRKFSQTCQAGKTHQETNHTRRKPKPSVAGFTEEIPKNKLRTVRRKI
jgi:hypothetical protein